MAYPTGELSVDLRAIAENWRLINKQLKDGIECGAVVKANAYGLGVDRIAPKIYGAGCRSFFVANFKEATQLQSLVGLDAKVFVLSGCIAGAESAFIQRGVIPVLVSYPMLLRWAAVAKRHPGAQAVLKVNSGMGRLGLEMNEFDNLLRAPELVKQAKIEYLMSHLACADDRHHPLNKKQIERFDSMRSQLADIGVVVKTTLSNSAGIFLGEQAHCDVVRPGIALYGGNPGLEKNPMHPVVGLSLPVIQVRVLPPGESIGYGATKKYSDERAIAIASGGYADGIMRSLSNRGWGFYGGKKVPIVGRISMDSTMFDVTDVIVDHGINEGDAIELLGDNVSIDQLAEAAGTISYEMLTSFGSRYQRCYLE